MSDDFDWRVRRALRLRAHSHWLMMWEKRRPLSPELAAKGVKSQLVEDAKRYMREAIEEIRKARLESD